MFQSNDKNYVYATDPRMPCKYGVKCYQKNKVHNEKYKHPAGRKEAGSKHVTKKFKAERKEKIITQFEDSDSDSNERKKIPSKTTKEKISITNDISDSDKTDTDLSDSEIKIHTEQKNVDIDLRHGHDNNATIKYGNEQRTTICEKNSGSNEDELEDCSDIFDTIDDTDIKSISNYKDFLREHFLINLPTNFFNFWNFCKKLKSNNPQEALKDIGLILVGPFDVLAGKFDNNKKTLNEYLIHWRYFRDPPEFQTVLKGDDKFGYHIGYFRDLPDEIPIFLCSNQSKKDGILTPMGGNIFAAVNFYLEDLKKFGDPFKKMHIGRIQTALKKETDALRMDMSKKTNEMVAREKKIVARSFNKIGLVVPFDKKTEVGYRTLALNDKELNTLLTKLENAKSDEEKSKFLSELQPVFTFANIATDECDFGTGIELGWNLLAHGIDFLNSTINDFLVIGYGLLDRKAFAKIVEAHMENRRKGCNLSIL